MPSTMYRAPVIWPLRAALLLLRTMPSSASCCSESTSLMLLRSTTWSSPVADSSLLRAWARSLATGPCHHQVGWLTLFLKSGTETVGRPLPPWAHAAGAQNAGNQAAGSARARPRTSPRPPGQPWGERLAPLGASCKQWFRTE